MKYNGNKIVTVVLICFLSILMCNITFAHSGRTDSSGGHKDNKNKSGLGSYHYHCGGHPAHLHTNGVCPYSSSSSSTTKTTSTSSITSSGSSSKAATKSTSSTYSSSETTKTVPSTIEAESIEINGDTKEFKVGESRQLTASILPENTTDKEITWETSDENVIIVNKTGKVTAKGEGKAYITVKTSNKKTDSITIIVTEDEKEAINNTINTVTNQNNVNKVSDTSSEDSNSIGTIILLGALGAGGYLGYKKYKK